MKMIILISASLLVGSTAQAQFAGALQKISLVVENLGRGAPTDARLAGRTQSGLSVFVAGDTRSLPRTSLYVVRAGDEKLTDVMKTKGQVVIRLATRAPSAQVRQSTINAITSKLDSAVQEAAEKANYVVGSGETFRSAISINEEVLAGNTQLVGHISFDPDQMSISFWGNLINVLASK